MNPSTRMLLMLSATASAMVAITTGCASTDAAGAARHTAHVQTLQTELLARSDPDALAASALLERELPAKDASRALGFAARAVAAAPGRADLLLEQIELCREVASCDSEPLEARLRQQDPENGISWTYALMRAANAGNAEAMRSARAGLAQSLRVSSYWTATVSRLTAVIAGKAGFDPRAAMVEVIGIEAALPAALQPVSKACSAQEVQQSLVMAQCRQIAAAFRRSDTLLFEAYGASLAARLWPDGTVEHTRISAERRSLHYQMDLMMRHAAEVDSASATNTLAALFTQFPTEQEAFSALYVRLGLDPNPPDGWQDRSPE